MKLSKAPGMDDPAGSKTPRPKVVAAGGGSLIGSQLGVLLIYAFEQLSRHDLPLSVEGAIFSLLAAAAGFAGGYLLREGS